MKGEDPAGFLRPVAYFQKRQRFIVETLDSLQPADKIIRWDGPQEHGAPDRAAYRTIGYVANFVAFGIGIGVAGLTAHLTGCSCHLWVLSAGAARCRPIERHGAIWGGPGTASDR